MTPQKISLLGFSDFENGGLSHITINFGSALRRLLASTTETNYVARENSLLRCQPSENFSPICQPSSRKDPLKTKRELADALF